MNRCSWSTIHITILRLLYLKANFYWRLLLFSRPVVSDSLQPHGLQHARPPCPSPSPRVCSSSCLLHRWCLPAISPSDALFSFCPQSFPASGTFPMSQLLASDDQNSGASVLVSVLSTNIQGWFPLRLTGLILLSKALFRSLLQHHSSKASILWCSVFFTVQLSQPHMTTRKTTALTRQQSNVSAFNTLSSRFVLLKVRRINFNFCRYLKLSKNSLMTKRFLNRIKFTALLIFSRFTVLFSLSSFIFRIKVDHLYQKIHTSIIKIKDSHFKETFFVTTVKRFFCKFTNAYIVININLRISQSVQNEGLNLKGYINFFPWADNSNI